MGIESSLIIITLNRAPLLRQTLAGLLRQTRTFGEIIVVDNGPSVGTEQAVLSLTGLLPLRYVIEPRQGYGKARNRGLREASGNVLYFLDDDCVAEPDWAATLWRTLASGEADLAGGSRISARSGLAARLEYLSTDGPVLSPRLAAGHARHLSTSNLILRREVVEKTGSFDDSLVMCEDRDFTARARRHGFRLRFEPEARVTHYSSVSSLSQYFAKMRHYGLGTCQYFERARKAEPLMRKEEPLARVFPSSPAARLLLLPFLAGAGTLYLAARNLPQNPDAVPLSPLLFAGQLWWHWGGFEAVRRYNGQQ